MARDNPVEQFEMGRYCPISLGLWRRRSSIEVPTAWNIGATPHHKQHILLQNHPRNEILDNELKSQLILDYLKTRLKALSLTS